MGALRDVAEANFTKRDRFKELAEARTNRALEDIRRIGNLSNQQLYEWEEAEVKKILRALRDGISEIEQRFAWPKARRGGGFTL